MLRMRADATPLSLDPKARALGLGPARRTSRPPLPGPSMIFYEVTLRHALPRLLYTKAHTY